MGLLVFGKFNKSGTCCRRSPWFFLSARELWLPLVARFLDLIGFISAVGRRLPSFSQTLYGDSDTDSSCLCRETYFIMDSKFVASVWIKSAYRISAKESLSDHPVVVHRKLQLQIICSTSGDHLNMIENQKS